MKASGGKILSPVSFVDFIKLDIRVGKVVKVDIVQGAKNLIRVKVDIGGEIRQTVAGLGQHYQVEDLADKEVIVVTNLQPRKIYGIESEVMLLAAVAGDDISLLQTDKKSRPGAKVS